MGRPPAPTGARQIAIYFVISDAVTFTIATLHPGVAPTVTITVTGSAHAVCGWRPSDRNVRNTDNRGDSCNRRLGNDLPPVERGPAAHYSRRGHYDGRRQIDGDLVHGAGDGTGRYADASERLWLGRSFVIPHADDDGATGLRWVARTLPATLVAAGTLISFDMFGSPAASIPIQFFAIPTAQRCTDYRCSRMIC